MPNHVHGILIIDKSVVQTLHATSLQQERIKQYHGKNSNLSNISPKKYTISSIIRSYKSAISKDSKKINSLFYWQSRFHEHIIHNQEDLNKISEYIQYNPKNWKKDNYFKNI